MKLKNRQKNYRKILRAYSGGCDCGSTGGTIHTPDGRHTSITRVCRVCGRVFLLLRDPGLDRPLVLPKLTSPPTKLKS